MQLNRMFPQLVLHLNKKVQNHKENLMYYMLFLRITPLVPNWFINLSSSIVGVPFKHFFFATLFGIIHTEPNFYRLDANKCYSCEHRSCIERHTIYWL